MHSLSQLSRRYLRRQWKRTLFTTSSIIMATALFAGLALLFTSFVNMYVRAEEADRGRWHYHVSGLTMTEADKLQQHANFEESERLAGSAWMASLSSQEDENQKEPDDMEPADRPTDGNWLLFRDISETGDHLTPYPMTVLKGRLPMNSSEIALNLDSLAYFPGLELNQTIELRLYDMTDRHSAVVREKTYTVTGFTEWTNTHLPGPVYYALTHLDGSDQTLAEVYLRVKAGTDYQQQMTSALDDVLPGLGQAPVSENGNLVYQTSQPDQSAATSVWNDLMKVRVQTHDQLLRFLGQSSSEETNRDLMTFFAILTAIIMVSVIFVIRNSFSMSVSERISEYGLLRVVGGAPEQIRRLVLFDAAHMALVAIPFGLLAGLLAMKITLDYVSALGLPDIEYLQLIVSPWPLVLAAALSLLAILLAVIAPAARAGRLSPMEAVRRQGVYSVKGQAGRHLIHKGLISSRLFGATGFLAGRSIRRDPKRFRVTTFSVMVSAVLFLAAGGISFLFSDQLSSFNSDQTDFTLFIQSDDAVEENTALAQIDHVLADDETVKQRAHYAQISGQPIHASPDIYSDELISMMQKSLASSGQGASHDQALAALADWRFNSQLILADRDFIDQLAIGNPDQVWHELQQGKVIMAQTIPISVADLSFQTIPLTRLAVGDHIRLDPISLYDQEEDQLVEWSGLPVSYEIAAELDQLPWFSEGFFSGANTILLIADKAAVMRHMKSAPAPNGAIGWTEILAVDAVDGQEAKLSGWLEKTAEHSIAGSEEPYLVNHYAELQMARGMMKMINVFVFGFTAVIVLISSMNIFNTVTTNVLLRRRELGMLQAVGMSRTQIRNMLLMESSLYGVNGAVWGSAIGTVLLYLLGSSIEGTMGSLTIQSIPWNLVAATLAGALLISILAGILPIRTAMKDQVVEAIRAQE